MLSARYEISRDAILGEKQVICTYEGHHRVVCPIHTGWEEKVLTYQFGGSSGPRPAARRRLAPHFLASAMLACGTARGMKAPAKRRKEQTCVVDAGLDINIHLRKLRADLMSEALDRVRLLASRAAVRISRSG